jgi:hypothetical protein
MVKNSKLEPQISQACVPLIQNFHTLNIILNTLHTLYCTFFDVRLLKGHQREMVYWLHQTNLGY